MELNSLLRGPMVGGTDVQLHSVHDSAGHAYVVLLQYGGKVESQVSGASKINGEWVRHPPQPPTLHPVVTFMRAAGGPRSTYDAATIVDLARCRAPFAIASLWPDESDVEFAAKDMERLGASIELALPDSAGRFTTSWVAFEDDGLPF